MLFGVVESEEPEWMTRVSGITGLRDYLEQEALERPFETIIVEHITEQDLKKFDKDMGTFITASVAHPLLARNDYSVKGNPIMLSLMIKEYEIADRLLRMIDKLSLRSVGRIVKLYANGVTVNFGKDEYSILNHLYKPGFLAANKTRSILLSRLANEADDLYDFTLEQTDSFKDEAVKKQFMQDIKSYPRLFEGKKCLYANDMHSLLFLMKQFPDDKSINQLLSNNSVGLYSLIHVGKDQTAEINSEIKCLGNIVNLLQKRIDTHLELFCFLLKIITELRRRRNSGEKEVDLCAKAESVIWEYVSKLPFEEENFYQLLLYAEGKSFRMEIVYELAHRKLGKKMTLYITDDTESVEYPFGFNTDKIHTYTPGCYLPDESDDLKGRLFQLVNDIGAISYSEGKLENKKLLGNELCDYLLENAELLKDVFAELLIYGFIPKECLDAIISKVNSVKRCAYMRPLLIAYKFGGLQNDKG